MLVPVDVVVDVLVPVDVEVLPVVLVEVLDVPVVPCSHSTQKTLCFSPPLAAMFSTKSL